MKFRLIAGSVVLFVIALGFNIFFNATSLERLYIETIFSEYRVIAKDIQRSLERGIHYGKKIENFTNIEKIFVDSNKRIFHEIINKKKAVGNIKLTIKETDVGLVITNKAGVILHSKNKSLSVVRLPDQVLKHVQDHSGDQKRVSPVNYIKYKNNYFSTLPIRDDHKNTLGIIAISLKEDQISKFLKDIFSKNIRVILSISATGIILIIGILSFLVPSSNSSKTFSKKRISIAIFLVTGSALIISCGYTTLEFSKYFLQINKENSTLINEQLKRDIEYLLQLGKRIDKLIKYDIYLGKIIKESPDIENITLFDHTDQPLYRATKFEVTDFQQSKEAYNAWVEATKPVSDTDYNIRHKLVIEEKYKGYFSTNASKDILFDKLIDNMMDSLTVIIISILFFVEMLILIFKYFERRVSGIVHIDAVDYGAMRPAAFLFLFGIDISVSFLPLHMENMVIPILNLSKETIMGLPISVEFLFVGISILISGIWLDRRGWHEPFIIGLIFAFSGILYSWLAPDAIQFIISRGVVGFGYGLSLMAAQGFVITYTDWKTKAQGLAHLFAGIYAGSICGTATGGMLAEWMGYAPVFLIGAIILLFVIAYTFLFMRNAMKKPIVPLVRKVVTRTGSRRFFRFLFNRTILGLIFFSSLPAAIAVIGFLNYFSPIYLNRIGATQSTIGQVLMLYGICLIYFGPFISRYVDSSNNKKIYILMGCFLGSMALIAFYFLDGIMAAVVAVLLLGLSSSLVLASQSVYALKLKVTKDLGEGKAIGIFRSTSRVGQMLGPIVFSAVISLTNNNSGITFLGLAYLLTALVFLIITQSDLKSMIMEDPSYES